jgi:hypothetical protein
MRDLPAQIHQDQLDRIKKDVKQSWDYFKDNYKRFNEFKMFLFKTNWSDAERASLNGMGKPDTEFNILHAYVDRLLGEFSKQEPSIEISSDETDKVEVQVIKSLEMHMNHIINDDSASALKFCLWKDLLVGGFSVAKITTEYKSPMSMQQEICLDRVFDPTLCAFDPMARRSHKGDGRFCVEFFPMEKSEFEREYPGVDVKSLAYANTLDGFNWSYKNGVKEIVIIADYYEKRKKHFKICSVRDETGKITTMRYDEYQAMIKDWELRDEISLPSQMVGKPRKTFKEEIVRYRVIANKVLEYVKTDYTMLPLVFFSGNSEYLKQGNDGETYQFTKPYIYHAKDAQKMKNFCGSSWSNAVENEVQHKWMIAKEALPKEPEFRRAIIDGQHASAIVYNSVHENNPNMPILNPITPVPKIPAPPEIIQGFTVVDSLMQQILGNYDASLGINNNQLSGVAVVESATQSNAAAMPYMVGFLEGIERCAQIYVELFPKYNTTPRSIPIRTAEGKREYTRINEPEVGKFDYEDGLLNVKIKAGASFQVQKSRTIMMVKELMGMSQIFQQFIGEKGINFLLDNMEGRGIEQLKEEVQEFTQQLEQQKQMAMQQAQRQLNPIMMRNQIEMQKLHLEQEKMQKQHMIDMLKLDLEHTKLDADLHMSAKKDAMELHKAHIEHSTVLADKSLEMLDLGHQHRKDMIEDDRAERDMQHRHEKEKKTADTKEKPVKKYKKDK